MGLFGSLVSLDAEGEHLHPLAEEEVQRGARHRFAAAFRAIIAAIRRTIRRG